MILNGISLIGFYAYMRRKRNKRVYRSLIEMIGDTPMIYLKSLSKLTNCEIYVCFIKKRQNVNLWILEVA